MSLRIRRGSDEQRLPITFADGEVVWVKSSTTSRPAYKLYVGDGLTAGGIDILQTSAGVGLNYNTNTGKLDVSGVTTTNVTEGTNLYFTNERAQDAIRDMFAAGTMSGIQFVYDDIANKMNVTVTASGGGGGGSGITALLDDPSPRLGGTLNINSQNITGTGNINIDGYAILSGTLEVPAGLNSNLPLNGFNITGEGDILIGGNASFTGTIISQTGLGADLSLNEFDLIGLGNINISGNLSVAGLGANLDLNSYNVVGTGNITNTGNINVSGTLRAATGLGGDLILNSHDITGTGDINIFGGVTSTSATITTINVGANVLTTDIAGSLTVSVGENPVIITGLQSSGNTQGAVIKTRQSRGTALAPTTVFPDDFLGGMTTTAHNGTDYVYSGNFGFIQDSNIAFNSSSTYVPSFFAMTVPNTTTAVNYIFDSAGLGTIPLVKTNSYSAAGTPLPSASVVGEGTRAFVSDAVSNSFGTAYSSGGTFKVPVYSDGTSWRIG